jgi:crotonobetainyl-CoA:carnitine CoA-transferase CaiB-like acyl-CoA transferase
MLPLPLYLSRALDLTTSGAGAYATRLMGGLGAEVIRVDRPSTDRLNPDLHCDKVSCRFELTTPEGQDLCLQLASQCHFVFADAIDATGGLDYDAVAGRRPSVIYVSLTGEDSPQLGVAAAAGALVALFHHRATGEGQRVDVDSEALSASLRGLDIFAEAASVTLPPWPALELKAPEPSGPIFEPVALAGEDVRPVAGLPYLFSSTPANVRLPPPIPGQHNDYVLRELLGLSAGEIERLLTQGVVVGAQ